VQCAEDRLDLAQAAARRGADAEDCLLDAARRLSTCWIAASRRSAVASDAEESNVGAGMAAAVVRSASMAVDSRLGSRRVCR
jgi:hypothetical protein